MFSSPDDLDLRLILHKEWGEIAWEEYKEQDIEDYRADYYYFFYYWCICVPIFYLRAQLDGGVEDEAEAEAYSEDAHHEQHQFVGNNLADVIAWSAFLADLQFYTDPSFA